MFTVQVLEKLHHVESLISSVVLASYSGIKEGMLDCLQSQRNLLSDRLTEYRVSFSSRLVEFIFFYIFFGVKHEEKFKKKLKPTELPVFASGIPKNTRLKKAFCVETFNPIDFVISPGILNNIIFIKSNIYYMKTSYILTGGGG